MKSKITIFALSLATVCMLSSCLNGDDDDTVTYDDTAVTGFTLGTLKYYLYKKASDGVTDTCYEKGSVTGSNYAVHIDQYNHTITNDKDSLPYGTDLTKVLVTVTTTNSGIATLPDSLGTTFYSFSSSDSLDFSKEKELRVISSSQKYYQSYKVHIVAHQEEADSFKWSKVGNIADLKKYYNGNDFTDDNKSLFCNNRLVLLSNTDSTKELGTYADGNWNVERSFTKEASMTTDGSTLYVADNGSLYSTSDFSQWDTIAVADIKCIYGICNNEMFALSNDNKMIVSYDNGKSWNDDKIDSDNKYLPTEDISFITQTTKSNSDIKRAFLIGNSDAYASNGTAVWSKIVEEDNTQDQSWMFQAFNTNNYNPLYYSNQMSVVPYDDGLLALYAFNKKLLFSQDCGITWKTDDKFTLPSDLETVNATMTVDKDKYLWILDYATGDVWKGRLNSEGWAIKD